MENLSKISKLIASFNDAQRCELINFYVKTALDKLIGPVCKPDAKSTYQLEGRKPKKIIGCKDIDLLIDLKQYSIKEYASVEKLVLDIKTKEIQKYILNNLKYDMHDFKAYFSKVSKWMKAIVKDIKKTFGSHYYTGGAVFEAFNILFVDEISMIFYSKEKFNSAGNQLLIDLKYYNKNVQSEHILELIQRFKDNFNENQLLSEAELEKIIK